MIMVEKIFEKGYVDQDLLMYLLKSLTEQLETLKNTRKNLFQFNEKKDSNNDFYYDDKNDFYVELNYEPLNKQNIIILSKEIVNGEVKTIFINTDEIIKLQENRLYLNTANLKNSSCLFITYQY